MYKLFKVLFAIAALALLALMSLTFMASLAGAQEQEPEQEEQAEIELEEPEIEQEVEPVVGPEILVHSTGGDILVLNGNPGQANYKFTIGTADFKDQYCRINPRVWNVNGPPRVQTQLWYLTSEKYAVITDVESVVSDLPQDFTSGHYYHMGAEMPVSIFVAIEDPNSSLNFETRLQCLTYPAPAEEEEVTEVKEEVVEEVAEVVEEVTEEVTTEIDIPMDIERDPTPKTVTTSTGDEVPAELAITGGRHIVLVVVAAVLILAGIFLALSEKADRARSNRRKTADLAFSEYLSRTSAQ